MAFDIGISSAIAQYVYTQTAGAVTEPVNGSYIQAYCEYLGITEPLNASWLQALCNHFGITEPLNGSWTIALANYYGITYPAGGTWWMAMAGSATPPVTELIWNETTSFWNATDVNWATDTTPPAAPVWTGSTFPEGDYTPTIVGTAEPYSTITLVVNAQTYYGATDELGDWSIFVSNALPPALAPGQQYLVSVTATDIAGNVSPAADDYIYIVQSTIVTITLDMYDSYGDGWNRGYFQLEKEETPGNWVPIEFNENPYTFPTLQDYINWLNTGNPVNALYYKTDAIAGASSGIYGLRYDLYEPGVTPNGCSTCLKEAIGLRSWDLQPGFNYRTVCMNQGSFANERSYDIRNGALVLASQPQSGAAWVVGTVQTTFTL